MADVVLSYARENRHQAEAVAGALESAGWNVWWDRAILPGTSYEQVIEAELSTARCVVVLWSAAARQSNWVRDEATLALSRNVLVSVLLDQSEPPLGFRQQQTANLSHWTGSMTDPEFVLLTQGVAKLVARGETPGAPPAPPTRTASSSSGSRKRLPATVIAILALGCVVAGTGAVLWSTGYLDRRDGSSPAIDVPVACAQEGGSSYALPLPANATVTLPRENVTLTLLSGKIERVNAETRAMSLHIRFSNNSTRSFYRTYYSTIRLLVDGIPRAPTDAPMAQVDASSAGEFDYTFDVPATATRAVLRVTHGDQSGDIALTLTASAR